MRSLGQLRSNSTCVCCAHARMECHGSVEETSAITKRAGHLTSKSTRWSGVRPTWRSVAPVRRASICIGTITLWCSATDTMICTHRGKSVKPTRKRKAAWQL